jgi:His-Xaa-Ser system radical SAM maturase HxsC
MISLKVKGTASNITETLVGKVTRNISYVDGQSIFIYEGGSFSKHPFPNLAAILSTKNEIIFPDNIPSVCSITDLSHLVEGDIVSIDDRGNIYSLYRINSTYNSILMTERCNNKCLMCSQPPKLKDDSDYLFSIYKKLIPLIPKECQQLGLTGGEPTLLGDKFFELLDLLQNELPQTEIHILTNGRNFSDWNYVQRVDGFDRNLISFGIPLYSDYFALHDYIVQAESAFTQTVQGLHNLARLNQRVEVRVVLHKLTIKRLEKLARYIYKNLPFVEHVVFMGLENTGFTPHNLDLLWIDPHDYMDALTEAILYLYSFRIPVSIYNLQLCTMPNILWKYSRKSISDWKKTYISECVECELKNQCGGFFESCKVLHSNHIRPIKLDRQN